MGKKKHQGETKPELYVVFQQTKDFFNAKTIAELQQEADSGGLDSKAELGFRLCKEQDITQDVEQ